MSNCTDLSFGDCEVLWRQARNTSVGKPIARNTWVVRVDDDTFGVKLHSTVVVRVHRGGKKTVYSGGWLTQTTRARINRFGGLNVWPHRGVWYSRDVNELCSEVAEGAEFRDGVMVVPELDSSILRVARILLPSNVRYEPALSRQLRKQYERVLAMPEEQRYLVVADAMIAA